MGLFFVCVKRVWFVWRCWFLSLEMLVFWVRRGRRESGRVENGMVVSIEWGL